MLKNLKAIVCVDETYGIGKKGSNKLEWKLPEDLQNFKKLTTNGVVVMGRKTFDSIGKPLPNRFNIVLSRNHITEYDATGSILRRLITQVDVNTVEEVLSSPEYINKDIWVIGGSEIYKLLLPMCNEVYLTKIHGDFKCDLKFPKLSFKDWYLLSKSNIELSSMHNHIYHYEIRKRKEVIYAVVPKMKLIFEFTGGLQENVETYMCYENYSTNLNKKNGYYLSLKEDLNESVNDFEHKKVRVYPNEFVTTTSRINNRFKKGGMKI